MYRFIILDKHFGIPRSLADFPTLMFYHLTHFSIYSFKAFLSRSKLSRLLIKTASIIIANGTAFVIHSLFQPSALPDSSICCSVLTRIRFSLVSCIRFQKVLFSSQQLKQSSFRCDLVPLVIVISIGRKERDFAIEPYSDEILIVLTAKGMY